MFSKYGEHLGNNIFMFDEDVYYAMIKEEKKRHPGMSWEDTVILNGYATEKELKEYYDSFNVKGFYLPLNDTEWYNTIDDFWGDTPGDKKAKELLKSGAVVFCEN